MLKQFHHRVRAWPTPVAGLALGIASLGACLENALPFPGAAQNTGALIAAVLLTVLAVRFVLHPDTLVQDIRHPVAGSIVPTFAMGVMVVSKALGRFLPGAGEALWLFAVVVHLVSLAFFLYYRAKAWQLHEMVPSWFVPPVGIVVADVTCPGAAWTEPALILLAIGMISYLVMLPVMIYRFLFHREIPDGAKPTIAIMAAPASLSLAGYLTVVKSPSLPICLALLGLALAMTLVTYLAFFRLMRLPFSPGYAAFTFPMAIGAIALYKTADMTARFPDLSSYTRLLGTLALAELIVATLVIGYVCLRFLHYYLFPRRIRTQRSNAGPVQ